MSILTLKNIRCEMDGKLLFEADGLTIEEGDVIGLIGKNGAGKTCLLKILAGELSDYAGYISGNRLTYFSELCITEDMTQSGGELSISSFLNALRQSVPLYLLDEPTTYLDQHHLKKVVRTIRRSPSSFCIASHDRAFLDAVATKIWLLEQGKITEYNGSFSDYVLARSMQLSQYEQELKQYQKEKKKIKQSLRMMKEKQDQKKGKPKKMSTSEYRIAGIKTKYGVKQKKLQKRITRQQKKLEQLKQPHQVEDKYDISFLSQLHCLPKRKIIIPSHEAKIGQKSLWHTPTIHLNSGDKLGIIGRNGAGKTTYLNYLVSVLPSTYKNCYFRQNHFQYLDPKMTVYEAIVEATNGYLSEHHIRTLLALLDFKRDKVFRLIGDLSRGEHVKISLLSLLVSESDILILDEMTNFLDIKAIEAVEKVLATYSGILIFVSHDQYFVQRLATSILDIDTYKIM